MKERTALNGFVGIETRRKSPNIVLFAETFDGRIVFDRLPDIPVTSNSYSISITSKNLPKHLKEN